MVRREEARICYDEQARTWLLEMATSSYALGATADGGGVHHLYWGRPVTLEDLSALGRPAELVRNGERTGWGADVPLEYSAFGGRRFDEPTLKVEFPDGTRAVEWQLGAHRIERDGASVLLTIELLDLAYPLAIELSYRIFDGHDVLERWATIEHRHRDELLDERAPRGEERADAPIVLRQSYSADYWLPSAPSWRLRYLHGGWARETQLAETTLTPGKLVLESRRGVTSHQLNPFVACDAEGRASEHSGEVYSVALAWSGSWKLVAEQTPSGRHHICGGWNEFDSPIELAPGRSIALPVLASCWSADGFGGVSRAWHAYALGHVLGGGTRSGASPSFPIRTIRSSAEPIVRPVLYNSWEATTFSVDEASQSELAARAARIGAELFVVDDGWFVGRHHDHAGLGDWQVDTTKFPGGLDPLIEKVNALGMGFGLWVEPEMVNPDSDLYRAHPDWVLHFAHRSRSEARHQLVLNLARPDVARFVFESLDTLLETHAIDFVKWDMNRHFSEPGWPEMAGRGAERIWIDHVTAVYDVLERLRRAHPAVSFESCSGGGGRVDLGILSRVEQVWTSDNTDAYDRIVIQEGFTQLYPPMAMMSWVTDSPNPLTKRRLPLAFRFHVAMAGSLGVGGDLAAWSDDELDEASELIATYKSIRHIVQLGHLYRLASLREGDIGAVQYLDDAGDEVVVLAWWGVRHFGPLPATVRLVALDSTSRYRDVATGVAQSGAQLMAFGVGLGSELDFGSRLVHLRRER